MHHLQARRLGAHMDVPGVFQKFLTLRFRILSMSKGLAKVFDSSLNSWKHETQKKSLISDECVDLVLGFY